MNASFFSGPRLAALLLLLLLPGGARAQAPAFDRAVGCGQPASGSFYAPYRLRVNALKFDHMPPRSQKALHYFRNTKTKRFDELQKCL